MPRAGSLNKIINTATLSLLLSGCAIHSDRTGKLSLDIDEAIFLGTKSQTFHVPDVGRATLRVFERKYSIKLEDRFQVIPIGEADHVEIRSVLSVGDRSIIIVYKGDRACRNTTQLIAIRGLEALSWDFGDCINKPTIGKTGDTLFFDFPKDNGNLIRSVYRNGVFNNGFGIETPTPNSQAIVSGTPRYKPEPPEAPDLNDSPGANKTSVNGSTVAQKSPRQTPSGDKIKTSSAILGKPLDFPAREQKPIRIILDN